jgi:hypothetical protein
MPLSQMNVGMDVKFFVALKEIVLIILMAYLAHHSLKLERLSPDVFAMFFALIYTFYLIRAGIGVAEIVSYREGVVMVGFYFVGRFLSREGVSFVEVLRVTGAIVFIVVLFGYFEYFLGGGGFWGFWGGVEYLNSKFSAGGGELIRSIGGVPHNWYTYVDDRHYRRMVATVGDATSFGRYVSFFIVAYIFCKKDMRGAQWTVCWVLAVGGLFLSLGRGGMIMSMLGIFVFFYRKRRYRLVVIPGAIFATVVLSQVSAFSFSDANSVRHIAGLTEGFFSAVANPYGKGLGASGQLASLYSEVDHEDLVGESYIGSLGVQMGFAGLLGYTLWMLSLVMQFNKVSKSSVEEGVRGKCAMMVALLLGIYITSFFANSAVAPISSGLIFLCAGLLLGGKNKAKNEYE